MQKSKPTPAQIADELGRRNVWDVGRGGKSILCKLCSSAFSVEKKFLAKQHLTTNKHKWMVEEFGGNNEPKPKQICLDFSVRALHMG